MHRSLSRRGFARAVGGAALAVGVPLTAGAPAAHADDAGFAALRDRWKTLMLGSGFDPSAEPFAGKLAKLGADAGTYRTAMAPTSASLWPDAMWSTDPAKITASYSRLRTMAQAYLQPGTGSTGDAALLDAVTTGLDHLYANAYHENQTEYGNWWDWQIGTPQILNDLCVDLFDHLSADQVAAAVRAVDHHVPDSKVDTQTGANLTDTCLVLAGRGIVGQSAAKLALARDGLSKVFGYATSGDGLYADGSFIQHTWIAYNGSYGAVLLSGLSQLIGLLGGSAWEVTDPNRHIWFDAVEDAFAPFLYNGLCMDAVSGRAISRGRPAGDARGPSDDQSRGHAIMASVLELGQGAGADLDARWRGLVKGWLQRASSSEQATETALTIPQLALLRGVLDDTGVTAVDEPVDRHRLFPTMDRAVHRGDGWAASLAMASDRITYYENGNGENLRGWHTGSGMLSWWTGQGTLDQYAGSYWATVDPYRLPGTTVSAKPLADGAGGAWGAPKPAVQWVGGATDGTCAAVGQHLEGLLSTLRARKSWFFVDDAVICLGAGITAADGQPVETVVDNRRLADSDPGVLTVDGEAQPHGFPWSETFPSSRWAHLAGHGGYIFPGGTGFTALRETRTGTWRDINTLGGLTTPVSGSYLTLLRDHGTDPTDADYAYVLLPGADAPTTARRAASRGWLQIVANTADQQGVRMPRYGVTAANFWAAGGVGAVTASAPASVLIRELHDGTAVVCVSDPTRRVTGLTLTWARSVAAVVSRPATVASATTGSSLTLTFGSLAEQMGATQMVRVRLG